MIQVFWDPGHASNGVLVEFSADMLTPHGRNFDLRLTEEQALDLLAELRRWDGEE